MMFSSQNVPPSVSNVSSGYKEKPLAVITPTLRPVLNFGISSENQHRLADGSLPTSPESDGDEVPGVGCFLAHNTREIIGDFFHLSASPSRSYGRHVKVLKTMTRVVDSLLVKHELVYKGNVGK